VGLGREGQTAHDETTRIERGSVGKGLRRRMVEQWGERGLLYSSKAAAGPCTRLARCGGR
jgi:hypothetical protein